MGKSKGKKSTKMRLRSFNNPSQSNTTSNDKRGAKCNPSTLPEEDSKKKRSSSHFEPHCTETKNKKKSTNKKLATTPAVVTPSKCVISNDEQGKTLPVVTPSNLAFANDEKHEYDIHGDESTLNACDGIDVSCGVLQTNKSNNDDAQDVKTKLPKKECVNEIVQPHSSAPIQSNFSGRDVQDTSSLKPNTETTNQFITVGLEDVNSADIAQSAPTKKLFPGVVSQDKDDNDDENEAFWKEAITSANNLLMEKDAKASTSQKPSEVRTESNKIEIHDPFILCKQEYGNNSISQACGGINFDDDDDFWNEVVCSTDQLLLDTKPEAKSVNHSPTTTQMNENGPTSEATMKMPKQNPYFSPTASQVPKGKYELIRDIHPVFNKLPWIIEAVVTEKSDILTYTNEFGRCQMFSAVLQDKSDYTIRAMFFNYAAPKFHSYLSEGERYLFSHGTIRLADPNYNKCKSRFEILFDLESKIESNPISGKVIGTCLARNENFNIFEDIENSTKIANLKKNGDQKICARVFRKHETREWSSEWSQGIRLSVELIDSSGVDITANMFHGERSRFSGGLMEGKTYLFTNFTLKPSNLKYKRSSSEMEMIISDTTLIFDVRPGLLPDLCVYNFLSTKEIAATKFKIFDLRAVVLKVGEPIQYPAGNGYVTKCDLTLVDDSDGDPVVVAVWENDVARVQKYCNNNPVVHFCPVCANNESTYMAIGQFYPTDQSGKGNELRKWWQTKPFGK